MNKVELIGRLVKDPDVRYTNPAQGGDSMAIARYRLAVDRLYGRKEGEQQTVDFIPCIAFGKSAEFAEKYLVKGIKIAVVGHLVSGNYTDKEGNKRFTLEIAVEQQEFVERKNDGTNPPEERLPAEEFIPIPDDIENDFPF